MLENDRKDEETKASFDLNLGGLLGGLGDLVDRLSELAETGEQIIEKRGEARIRGLEEEGRAVYGFSVRMGLGGKPEVERFGNVRSTNQGPEVANVREPLLDLFDEKRDLLIVVELPGVAAEEIEITVEEDILTLETTGERKYAKEVLLPALVDENSLEQTYRNGILEIRLRKR